MKPLLIGLFTLIIVILISLIYIILVGVFSILIRNMFSPWYISMCWENIMEEGNKYFFVPIFITILTFVLYYIGVEILN